MSNIFRLTLMLSLVVVVSLVAALLQPEWASDLGLDGVSVTDLEYQLFGDPAMSTPPIQGLVESLAAKDRAIRALCDGRITLFEAAALFRHWDSPQALAALPKLYSGDSEEERLCWQVIAEVRGVLECHDQNATELVSRWEEELSQHKQRHGRVILPTEPLSLEELDAIRQSRSPRPE